MKIALAAGLFLASLPFVSEAAESPSAPPSFGACVWEKLPQKVRSDYLQAHGKAGPTDAGMKVLEAASHQIKAEMAVCARRTNVPRLWVAGSVGSHAIQTGALAALAPVGIDRARLLAAWEAAPQAARACTLAHSAKLYSLPPPACSSEAAPLALLALVGIPERQARPADADQVLAFYHALSQEKWVQQLITMLPAPTMP